VSPQNGAHTPRILPLKAQDQVVGSAYLTGHLTRPGPVPLCATHCVYATDPQRATLFGPLLAAQTLFSRGLSAFSAPLRSNMFEPPPARSAAVITWRAMAAGHSATRRDADKTRLQLATRQRGNCNFNYNYNCIQLRLMSDNKPNAKCMPNQVH